MRYSVRDKLTHHDQYLGQVPAAASCTPSRSEARTLLSRARVTSYAVAEDRWVDLKPSPGPACRFACWVRQPPTGHASVPRPSLKPPTSPGLLPVSCPDRATFMDPRVGKKPLSRCSTLNEGCTRRK